MTFLSNFWHAVWFTAANIAWMLTVLWGFERLWPHGVQASVAERIKAIKFWAVAVVAGAFFTTASRALMGDAEPLLKIEVYRSFIGRPLEWVAYIVAPLVFLAVYDFFNYWIHRAQHKWFWKQHSIHHSIEELSGVNSYFHWTEQIFRVAFISMPTALLFDVGIDGGTLFVSMLVAMQGNYIHSPVRLHFGWFRYVIADNRYHRIHHSVEVHHLDKNFATATPIWDILFGTAHFPAKEEWPATGVPDVREPATINDFLWRPFRQVRGYAEAGTVKPLSEA